MICGISPQMLFANALAEGGITVFRYVYGALEYILVSFCAHLALLGAIFADNEPWPTAGAWHSSERSHFSSRLAQGI
jgi:hypothetical protein